MPDTRKTFDTSLQMPWRTCGLGLAAAMLLSGCSTEKPAEVGSQTESDPPSLALGGSPSDTPATGSTELIKASPDGTTTAQSDTVFNSNPQAVQSNPTADSNATFQPTDLGIGAPSGLDSDAPSGVEILGDTPQPTFESRPFTLIRPVDSNAPADLFNHLQDLDKALGDLVLAGSGKIVNEEQFVEFGMRLGNMKLEAGQRLANSPTATAEQRNSGVVAQLIALSHMSGLRDVESAKQLETLAKNLIDHSDPGIAHQSRVIMLGFALQNLQNGVDSDPSQITEQVQGLWQRPEDRNFPEFLIAERTYYVLLQMGFADEAGGVKSAIVEEYRNHPDPNLSAKSWALETGASQAFANYNNISSTIGTEQFNPSLLVAAARDLCREFPQHQTFVELANSMTRIERSGKIELSQLLADTLREAAPNLAKSGKPSRAGAMLADHASRVGLIGKSLEVPDLVDWDGNPVDIKTIPNALLLVDFWATDCLPCLQEIPRLRRLHAEFEGKGFTILSVNVNSSPEDARRYLQSQQLPWRQARLSDAPGMEATFLKQHGIRTIPFTMLVASDGTISTIHAYGQDLEAKVRREMLNMLAPNSETGDSLIP